MVIGSATPDPGAVGGVRPKRWAHIVDLMLEDYDPVLQEVFNGNVIHYDMDVYPERGDALDHFDEASAVIADHLYYDFIGGTSLGTRFYYNNRNQDIVKEAEKAGIPLFVIGDYPMNARKPDIHTRRGLRVYLPSWAR